MARQKAHGRPRPQHPIKTDHSAERDEKARKLVAETRQWAEQSGKAQVTILELEAHLMELVAQAKQKELGKKDHWRLVGERARELLPLPAPGFDDGPTPNVPHPSLESQQKDSVSNV